jgi:hypothetical protein
MARHHHHLASRCADHSVWGAPTPERRREPEHGREREQHDRCHAVTARDVGRGVGGGRNGDRDEHGEQAVAPPGGERERDPEPYRAGSRTIRRHA